MALLFLPGLRLQAQTFQPVLPAPPQSAPVSPNPDQRVRPAQSGAPDAGNVRIRAVTQECTRILEEEIRRRPECWLWMHNRWRTRPASAATRRTASDGAAAEARSLP